MKKVLPVLLLLITASCYAQTHTLDFDGSDDYIQIPDNNAIDLSVNFTLEAWIYPTGVGSQPTEGGMIFNKEGSYEIARYANGTIQFALSTSGAGNDWAWINTGLVAPLNQWSHIALVKNGSTVTVYLNVTSTFSIGGQPATMTGNSNTLRIAGRTNITHNFDGYIDEARVWNTARTQSEIKTHLFHRNLTPDASGLVACYRMNDGAGLTATNYCTNTGGINGTLVNGPNWVASPIQYDANALVFDGTDDQVTIPDNNSLDITTAITLEAWVYATKNTGIQNVISKSSTTQNNGYIFPRTDNGWTSVSFYLHVGGGWQVLTAPFPSLNAWHHLAATYNGTAMRLFVNGTEVTSMALSGAITVNTNVLALGNQQGFLECFGGRADEFRVWNVARTPAEILANMNKELNPAAETNLVSYYSVSQGIASGANNGLLTLPDMKSMNDGVLINFALTGSTSNYIIQNNSFSTLPLKWLSFTARLQDEKVMLNWTTAEEQNTRDFIIQHSTNNVSWNDIANMPAAGNSIQARHYSYVHATPVTGNNFYRIKQRDLDNKSSYSPIRHVKFQMKAESFLVMDNPVVNGVIRVQVNESTQLSLYDINGKLLFKKQANAGLENIDVSRYAKGIYLLKTDTQEAKVILQ